MVPIHTIWLEILLEILDLATLEAKPPGTDHRAYYASLHQLAQVAVRWEKAIKRCPRFWTAIDNQLDPSLWRAAFLRSRGSPLTIHSNSETNHHPLFALAAAEHVEHWKAIVICFQESRRDFELMVPKGSVPRLLQSLTFSASMFCAVDIFKSGASRLECLAMHNVTLKDWGTSFLFGLKHLRLCWIQSHHPDPAYKIH